MSLTRTAMMMMSVDLTVATFFMSWVIPGNNLGVLDLDK